MLQKTIGWMNFSFFTKGVQMQYSPIMKHSISMVCDREPIIHTLTIYSGYNAHRLIANKDWKVYTVKKELLNVGKIIVKDNCGNSIPMYDLERTICDLIRSRNSIEIQDFSSVLKTYVSRKDKDLNKLMEYAKLFHVQSIIRKYLEVLL